MAGSQVEAEILAHLVEHNPQTRAAKIEGFGDPPKEEPFLLSLRPTDVARLRHQLFDWWSRPGEWQLKMAGQGRRSLPGWKGTYQNDARGAQLWIADSFAAADLYWVSPE